MAGSFGLQYPDFSTKIGESALFPALRKAEKDMLIVASGFDCYHQISTHSDRTPIHFAEALDMGL